MSRGELDRRVFVKLAAAAASLSACTPTPGGKQKHVAVVGGGIIGASIAYHLARDGARVTLLERGSLASLASFGTFAWINATWAKQPRTYHAFNQAGLSGWKRLQSDLDIPIKWGGSLEWFPSAERQAKLVDQIAEQVVWGEPARMISQDEAAALEPNLIPGTPEEIAYSPNDGAVDPVLATQRLAAAAQQSGAAIVENCDVQNIAASDDRATRLETTCGSFEIDDIVLATGADPNAPELLGGLPIPQRSTPGVIVITTPQPRLINRIIVAPGVHIHQRDDGRIVLGEQDGAPDTQAHSMRLRDRPTRFPDPLIAEQHAMRILEIAERFVPGIGSAEIEDVVIGWRPLPIDGHPVIGRSPNRSSAYFAIMHSGVTLAPIVGELVAKEILTGFTAKNLDAYRPDRDFQTTRRY